MAEIIDIGISKIDDNGPTISLNGGSTTPKSVSFGGSESVPDSSSAPKSVNFGPGLDMLMNDKRKQSTGPSSDINLDDLNKLEADLNDLSDTKNSSSVANETSTFKLNIDDTTTSKGGNVTVEPVNIKLDTSDIGKASSSNEKKDDTWDGFKKFNDIPVNPDVNVPKEPQLTKKQLLAEKFKYLRKLETIERKGAKLSKKYSMEDSLDEMRGEYELLMAEKERSNSTKFQGKIMMACVTALEFLNNKFDPFDFKLDGWSESVQENIDDYDEIFAELHDKYSSKAKMAPELKLLFQLGGSAVMLHMTNTMFKSAMPGMDYIMRQNPELMQQFTQAAVSSMGQQNPGFGNFMGGIMGGGQPMPPRGSPPGPSQPDYTQRRPEIIPPGPSNRPDIGMSRGLPDFGDSVNMEDNFGSISLNQGKQMTTENKSKPASKPPPTTPRAEMKGPSDLNHLLSGLKTKKVEVRQKEMMGKGKGNGSTISIDELKSISKDADIPRKSKRRPRSERNTVSLDI